MSRHWSQHGGDVSRQRRFTTTARLLWYALHRARRFAQLGNTPKQSRR